MDPNNVIATVEYPPGLATELDGADEVSVRLDCFMNGGNLNFLMVDTTPWPPGSHGRAVVKADDGNTYLVVERGRDRIFDFSLSPKCNWVFDTNANPLGEPITFKKGDAQLYKVTPVSPTSLQIYAKARPNMPVGNARDLFNIHVLLTQDSGTPIALRIDPGSDNPP